jgi:hypothetical protein
VRGIANVCQQTAVNGRMKRLDAAVEGLRKARDFRNVPNRDAGFAQDPVPPVLTISNPSACSARANSATPALSVTEIRARGIA